MPSIISMVKKIIISIIKKISPQQMLIMQGPLTGWRWVTLSSTYQMWLGTYEIDKQYLFMRNIDSGKIVFDIGANVGLYSLLAAKAVGPHGSVYAFEPLPRNVSFLRRNLEANKIQNAFVFEAAVSDRKGTVQFNQGEDHATGFIGTDGDIEIQTVSLDDLVSEGQVHPPDYLKIDVEGAESSVLNGASKILHQNRPEVFLAIHGSEQLEKCKTLLTSANYRFEIFGEATDIQFKSISYDYIAEIHAIPNES